MRQQLTVVVCNCPIQTAYDAATNTRTTTETQRMANRNNVLTYSQLIGIAELGGVQTIRVNSQYGHVVPRVLTHQRRRQLAAVVQLDINLRSTINCVPVCQNVPVGAVNEARCRPIAVGVTSLHPHNRRLYSFNDIGN